MITLFENFKGGLDDDFDYEHSQRHKDRYNFLSKCIKFFEKIIRDNDNVRMKFVEDDEYVSIVIEESDIFTVLIDDDRNLINIFYDRKKVHKNYPFIFKYVYETLNFYLKKFKEKGDNIDAYFKYNHKIKNVKFNIEDFERFKDTERFGL